MSASLVGSEMCIRDRHPRVPRRCVLVHVGAHRAVQCAHGLDRQGCSCRSRLRARFHGKAARYPDA
eukprot:7271577-Alexandrium_andersonii.AAC.1